MKKKKNKLNPADLQKSLEKKLNAGRKPAFSYDVSQVAGNEFIEQVENATTQDILKYLDQTGMVGELYPLMPCICIVCDELAFKLLNLDTIWAYEPYNKKYCYYFAPNDQQLLHLAKCKYLDTPNLKIYKNYTVTFTKGFMLKFCPQWQKYHLSNLPKLTDSMVSRITALAMQLEENKENYFLINKLTNKYRISQTLCGRLASSVLPLNTHVVLERLLQMVSHTSAILVNKDLDKPYKFNFKDFIKPLKFRGKSASKQDIAINALQTLIDVGILDSYTVKDGDIYITSTLITKHIRQQIHRTIGYYAGMPASKPCIVTFVNYLNWIINANHEKLTIALDTLLHRLNLERLLKESRLGEIAKVLTDLRNVGVEYGLLSPLNGESASITATDVKYLLNNRTELYKYIQLNAEKAEEDK